MILGFILGFGLCLLMWLGDRRRLGHPVRRWRDLLEMI